MEGNQHSILPQLQEMLRLRLPKSAIARNLRISRPTLYKILSETGYEQEIYNNISDANLDIIVREIKQAHPSAGHIMVQGHLLSRGIHVPRHCLRSAMHRVDPIGIQNRSLKTIRRRVYSVPGPNFMWHIDGTHKLIRWRFVFHMGIDGFSRLIVFGQCSNNNKSSTVLALFEKAQIKYGKPLRIRTDEGGENVKIWRKMQEQYHDRSNPVILGSSVHNQRVERLHRDVNEQVSNHFYNKIYEMESMGMPNPENITDLFCLHYVFIPLINKRLHEFILAHNNHKLSTEKNRTPLQLFYLYYFIRETEDEPNFNILGGMPLSTLDKQLPYVHVLPIHSPISTEQHEELQRNINPLLYNNPLDAYRDTVAFVARYIS